MPITCTADADNNYTGNTEGIDLSGKENFNAVDLAKFFCAILVVAIHVLPFGSTDIKLLTLFNYGVQDWLARIAVPFFFTASGFFLYRKTTAEEFSFSGTKTYIIKLLRLYVIWSLIYLPLKIEDISRIEGGTWQGILTYFHDAVFTGSFTHLWYFPALIFAVLLVSLMLLKRIKPGKIVAAASVFYLIGLTAQSWFGLIAPLSTVQPGLWSFFKLCEKVITTTRDGLFEGFLFVSIGAYIAFKGFKMSQKKAFLGFAVSFLMMFLEVWFVGHFNLAREHDMYIFLAPSSYFAFGFAVNCRLPGSSGLYKTLRVLSSLIFYIHLYVRWGILKVLNSAGIKIGNTCLVFLLTVIISIVLSYGIYKLSENRNFKWLKRLYS